MNNTQSIYIWNIRELAKVSAEEAQELFDTIESEALLDWSEATNREIKTAISYAQHYIAKGWSWE